MNINDLNLPPDISGMEPEPESTRPICLREPATAIHLKTVEEYTEAANAYFRHCYDNDVHPRLASFALAIGLPGVSSVHRLGRRRPDLREIISRCITTIASWYEEELSTSVSKGAIFALKHLHDFDLEEEAGAPALPFWQEKKEIVLENRIVGVQVLEEKGKEYSPQEAYMRIVRGQNVVEISQIKENGEESPPERVLNPPDLEYIEDAEVIGEHGTVVQEIIR